jgi:hypothetical protein
MDIIVTVQVRDAGKLIGRPITEWVTHGSYLAGLGAEHQDHMLNRMIRCAFLDEAVLQAAIAAIRYGEGE